MKTKASPNPIDPELNNRERIREMGRMIRQKRVAERLTLERAAEQSGVSAATLSRLERQADLKSSRAMNSITPDTRTIAAIVRWLGVSLDNMIEGERTNTAAIGPKTVEGKVVVEGEIIDGNLPQIVEAYLRADRNLSPQAAASLAEMFQLAYRLAAQKSESQQALEQQPDINEGD